MHYVRIGTGTPDQMQLIQSHSVGTEKVLTCALMPRTILLFIGTQMIGQMAVVVSIDRLLATVFPFKYYSFGVRYSTVMALSKHLNVEHSETGQY